MAKVGAEPGGTRPISCAAQGGEVVAGGAAREEALVSRWGWQGEGLDCRLGGWISRMLVELELELHPQCLAQLPC